MWNYGQIWLFHKFANSYKASGIDRKKQKQKQQSMFSCVGCYMLETREAFRGLLILRLSLFFLNFRMVLLLGFGKCSRGWLLALVPCTVKFNLCVTSVARWSLMLWKMQPWPSAYTPAPYNLATFYQQWQWRFWGTLEFLTLGTWENRNVFFRYIIC